MQPYSNSCVKVYSASFELLWDRAHPYAAKMKEFWNKICFDFVVAILRDLHAAMRFTSSRMNPREFTIFHRWTRFCSANMYSTNCDLVTPWLCSTKLKCLYLEEFKHNHILRENKNIWSCLRASIAILFCCDVPRHNATVRTATFSFNAFRGLHFAALAFGSF